jgi:hypothetical protein
MYDPGGGVVIGGGALGAGGLAGTGFDTMAWVVAAVAVLIAGVIFLRAASVRVCDEAAGRGRHRK